MLSPSRQHDQANHWILYRRQPSHTACSRRRNPHLIPRHSRLDDYSATVPAPTSSFRSRSVIPAPLRHSRPTPSFPRKRESIPPSPRATSQIPIIQPPPRHSRPPLRHSRESGNLLSANLIVQVLPPRVILLNKFNLPCPIPFLECLFPLARE